MITEFHLNVEFLMEVDWNFSFICKSFKVDFTERERFYIGMISTKDLNDLINLVS